MKEMKNKLIATGGTIGVLIAAAVALEFFTDTLPGEIPSQQRKGQDMVNTIVDFHQANQRYPTDLNEAGVVSTWTRFGHWKYSDHTNSFILTLGDYSHCFVLEYESTRNYWVTDR